MSNSHDHGSGGHHGGHHLVPIKTYRNILFILFALTILTVAVAKPVSGFDAGVFNALIAFAVATVKAALVLAIFMGLKYDKKLNLVIFLTGVFFLVVMISFCMLDIYSRIKVDSTL
jgi:cytochrome c oxidase subunit IV